MVIQNSQDSQFDSIKAFDTSQRSDSERLENQLIQTRIRIRIPQKYYSEPIISRLVSQYGLTVNFAAAMLGSNDRDDGWFDLEIRGTSKQISSAEIYLNDLDLEMWHEPIQSAH